MTPLRLRSVTSGVIREVVQWFDGDLPAGTFFDESNGETYTVFEDQPRYVLQTGDYVVTDPGGQTWGIREEYLMRGYVPIETPVTPIKQFWEIDRSGMSQEERVALALKYVLTVATQKGQHTFAKELETDLGDNESLTDILRRIRQRQQDSTPKRKAAGGIAKVALNVPSKLTPDIFRADLQASLHDPT